MTSWSATSPNGTATFASAARRCAELVALALLALAPLTTAGAEPVRAAVLVTQAAGAGDLPDRLGALTAEIASMGSLEVIRPDDARAKLLGQGLDPRSCGTDAACLGDAGARLHATWVVALGVGRFGELWGLDVRALEVGKGPPRVSSATWADPGPDWTVALRQALERVLPAGLLAAPARLALRSGQAAARATLDGRDVGTTPIADLAVPPGKHRIELRQEGHAGAVREIELASGQRADLDVPLLPLGSRDPGPWPVLAGGVGVAALAAAVVLQLSAASLHSKAAGETFPLRSRDQDAALGRQTAAIVAAGVGLAGVGGYFLLR